MLRLAEAAYNSVLRACGGPGHHAWGVLKKHTPPLPGRVINAGRLSRPYIHGGVQHMQAITPPAWACNKCRQAITPLYPGVQHMQAITPLPGRVTNAGYHAPAWAWNKCRQVHPYTWACNTCRPGKMCVERSVYGCVQALAGDLHALGRAEQHGETYQVSCACPGES